MENLESVINDIANAVQIIDACSQRGAFKGEELANVGITRNNLANFVIATREEMQKNADARANMIVENADTVVANTTKK